jgi:hypothetical protein
MYGALWRVLPGPWWLRVLLLTAAFAVILVLLVMFVFPPIDELIAPSDVTVESS